MPVHLLTGGVCPSPWVVQGWAEGQRQRVQSSLAPLIHLPSCQVFPTGPSLGTVHPATSVCGIGWLCKITPMSPDWCGLVVHHPAE